MAHDAHEFTWCSKKDRDAPLPPLLSGHRSIQRSNFPHWGKQEGSDGSIDADSVSGRWKPKGAAGGVCPRQPETAAAAAVDRRPDGQTDPLGSGSLRSSARKPHSAPSRASRSAGSGWEDSCCVQRPSDISASPVTTPIVSEHVVKKKVLKPLLV